MLLFLPNLSPHNRLYARTLLDVEVLSIRRRHQGNGQGGG